MQHNSSKYKIGYKAIRMRVVRYMSSPIRLSVICRLDLLCDIMIVYLIVNYLLLLFKRKINCTKVI